MINESWTKRFFKEMDWLFSELTEPFLAPLLLSTIGLEAVQKICDIKTIAFCKNASAADGKTYNTLEGADWSISDAVQHEIRLLCETHTHTRQTFSNLSYPLNIRDPWGHPARQTDTQTQHHKGFCSLESVFRHHTGLTPDNFAGSVHSCCGLDSQTADSQFIYSFQICTDGQNECPFSWVSAWSFWNL